MNPEPVEVLAVVELAVSEGLVAFPERGTRYIWVPDSDALRMNGDAELPSSTAVGSASRSEAIL